MAPKRVSPQQPSGIAASGSNKKAKIALSNKDVPIEDKADPDQVQVETLVDMVEMVPDDTADNAGHVVTEPTTPPVSDSHGLVLGPFLNEEEIDRDWALPSALNKRVNTILNWYDPSNVTASPSKFPRTGYWATKFDNDFSEYFHDSRRRTPITLWIVGRLAGLYLFRADGTPERQANVTFTPLNNVHLNVIKSLLRTNTTPSLYVAADGLNTLKAGKWMNRRVPGEAAEICDRFASVYDATVTLRAKSKMTVIPAENLKRGDLMLFEVYLNRYRDRTMDAYVSPGRAGQRAVRAPTNPVDAKWRACLVLKSLCLLDDTGYVEAGGDETERSDDDSDLAI
ncbi:hypothetical protein CALVIDRAFT_568454 [Calocera viscosa TUFC12733]|uniref:Uncharacterized protein n=1 Tax=Calocera viscosa (strain TUFC12733) TaxID=1330018 RepID=A0A167H392_CALVF|nr:hypothetical protein CALVIDRAFT_568454 [Calocera viscosa TUFC12733]